MTPGGWWGPYPQAQIYIELDKASKIWEVVRKSAMWSKRVSELEDISRISEQNLHTPLSGC